MKKAVFFIFISLLMCGCQTEKHYTEEVHYKDSTIISIKEVMDTTHVIVRDSTHEVSKKTDKSTATIIFKEGGGSYNPTSGEICGINKMDILWDIAEEKEKSEYYLSELLQVTKERDSLQTAIKQMDENKVKDTEKKESPFHKFLLWYFLISLPIILVYAYIHIYGRIYARKA